jgi:hypothetical protein
MLSCNQGGTTPDLSGAANPAFTRTREEVNVIELVELLLHPGAEDGDVPADVVMLRVGPIADAPYGKAVYFARDLTNTIIVLATFAGAVEISHANPPHRFLSFSD